MVAPADPLAGLGAQGRRFSFLKELRSGFSDPRDSLADCRMKKAYLSTDYHRLPQIKKKSIMRTPVPKSQFP
jgi:hypothetical protein